MSRGKNKIFQALIASLLLHGLLYWLYSELQVHPKPNQKEAIRIEILPPQQKANSIVDVPQQKDINQNLKQEKKSKPYLSDKKRRVASEQVQSQFHRPLPHTNKHSPKSPTRRSLLSQLQPREDFYSQGPARTALPTIPFPNAAAQLLPPGLKIGEVTSLNSDEYLYYSFYSRVNNQIAFHWVHLIDRAARRYLNPRVHSARDWVTHIEVILDANGKYEDAFLIKKSGIKAFDEAALQAFRISHLFPHPPKAMIDPDSNKVHLNYSFRLIWDPNLYGRR
jgi:TonB family protein